MSVTTVDEFTEERIAQDLGINTGSIYLQPKEKDKIYKGES